MISDSVSNSVLVLDKLLSKAIAEVNELEDVKYEKIIESCAINRINALLNQVYQDRLTNNYKSAIRKCVFLQKLVARERRRIDEG